MDVLVAMVECHSLAAWVLMAVCQLELSRHETVVEVVDQRQVTSVAGALRIGHRAILAARSRRRNRPWSGAPGDARMAPW